MYKIKSYLQIRTTFAIHLKIVPFWHFIKMFNISFTNIFLLSELHNTPNRKLHCLSYNPRWIDVFALSYLRYDVQHKKVEGGEICRRRNYCLNWWASWWWDTRRCLDGIVIGSDPWGHQRSQKKVEEEKISTPAPPIYSLKKKDNKKPKSSGYFFWRMRKVMN